MPDPLNLRLNDWPFHVPSVDPFDEAGPSRREGVEHLGQDVPGANVWPSQFWAPPKTPAPPPVPESP